jgi:hypothetical protein
MMQVDLRWKREVGRFPVDEIRVTRGEKDLNWTLPFTRNYNAIDKRCVGKDEIDEVILQLITSLRFMPRPS